MEINDILNLNPAEAIGYLRKKTIAVPSWAKLVKEYDQKLHPVKTDATYTDKITKSGVEKMCRITLGWQKLAVKRIAEMCFAIPPKRVYKPQNDAEQAVARIIEDIYRKNRINSVNIQRGRQLFASCEMMTLWYPQDSPTIYGGEASAFKLRCKTFSPMHSSQIYPLFDDFDDLIALSVEYNRTEDEQPITYFDTYTAEQHVRWRIAKDEISEDVREPIGIGKIPAVYIHRNEPIWEDQSDNVAEAEWTLSRNGNYIRKNARPTWVVFMDDETNYNSQEPVGDNIGRNVLKYPANAKANYVTWTQAIESIKFHTEEIKRNFFRQLQLPDMSMDEMKSTPMSGEARKMMFIDAQLKVIDESGALLEFLDRELNVIRAFVKQMFPHYADAVDSLRIDYEITPYTISDLTEQIQNYSNATGGKQIMSTRQAVAHLGFADDIDEELSQIESEQAVSAFNLLPNESGV